MAEGDFGVAQCPAGLVVTRIISPTYCWRPSADATDCYTPSSPDTEL